MSCSESQVVDLINQEELPSSVQAELAINVNSEDISDVTNTITQYLWLAKSDQNKRND